MQPPSRPERYAVLRHRHAARQRLFRRGRCALPATPTPRHDLDVARRQTAGSVLLGLGPAAGSVLSPEATRHTFEGQLEAAGTLPRKVYTFGPASTGLDQLSLTFGGIPAAAEAAAVFPPSASPNIWTLNGKVPPRGPFGVQSFSAILDPSSEYVIAPFQDAIRFYTSQGITPRVDPTGRIVADCDCNAGVSVPLIFDGVTVDRVGDGVVISDASSRTGCIAFLVGASSTITPGWTLGGPFFNVSSGARARSLAMSGHSLTEHICPHP